MSTRFFLWFIMIASSQAVLAQKKDTLFLKNNAVLIGQLRKIQFGKIEFDQDGVSILSVKNDRVRTLSAESRTFRIQTIDKKLVYGALYASSDTGSVGVANAENRFIIGIPQISELTAIGTNWFDQIWGNVGAGYSYSKSSGIGRFTFSALLAYTAKKFKVSLDGDMLLTVDNGVGLRERENAMIRAAYLFDNNLSPVVMLNYQRNIQLELAKRWQQGVGLGYLFLQREHHSGTLLTGLILNEELSTRQVTRNSLEYGLQFKYDFYSFRNPNLSISTAQNAFMGITESGRYRHDANLGVKFKVWGDLSVNFTFNYSFDSRSPGTGSRKSDYNFVSGLQYEFN